jgi:ribulose-5-phosphate 4-epimerase/fuculose-1-phosphate aldolase
MDDLGITDMAHNHICARVPGEPDAFIMKQPEAFFEEVTASNLEKYDLEGNPRQDGLSRIRGAGIFHAAVLKARPDINATIHSHSPANIGVSAHKFGLLPISQHALHFIGKVAHHDYGGLEADPTLIPKIVSDLGDKSVAILRNHGALVCGKSTGEAFIAHFQFEMACRAQVAALSAGMENVTFVAPASQDYTIQQFDAAGARRATGGKDWQGFLRRADRLFSDYRD